MSDWKITTFTEDNYMCDVHIVPTYSTRIIDSTNKT